MTRSLALLLLVLPVAALPAPSAEEVVAAAARAQGGLSHDAIRDIRIAFSGHTVLEGQGVRTVRQVYSYRASDRAFRLETGSRAVQRAKSEHGVHIGPKGKEAFWERAGKGRVIRLQRGNRDDRKSIRAIKRERADFEGMLHMVLLSRLLDGKSKLSPGAEAPVLLERDLPHEAVAILGRERAAHRYHVVDVTREGEPRLRLYIRTSDHTVRKAVQFDAERPERIAWVYYFGPYREAQGDTPRIPYYFSAHTAVPTDPESKEKTTQAYGEITVTLNSGLTDEAFAPPKQ